MREYPQRKTATSGECTDYLPGGAEQAIEDWKIGKIEDLKRIGPVAHYILDHPELALELIDIAIKRDNYDRVQSVEELAKSYRSINSSEPVTLIDRPYDIIDKYEDLLLIEKCMMKEGILNKAVIFNDCRKDNNAGCLTGAFQYMWSNGFFKKYDSMKTKRKKISKTDALKYLNERYGSNITDDFYRKDPYFLDLAYNRLGILKELDKKNNKRLVNRQNNNIIRHDLH